MNKPTSTVSPSRNRTLSLKNLFRLSAFMIFIVLLAGGIISFARARQTGYACLKFYDFEDNPKLFDMNTGFVTLDRYERFGRRPESRGQKITISPDHNLVASLKTFNNSTTLLIDQLTPEERASYCSEDASCQPDAPKTNGDFPIIIPLSTKEMDVRLLWSEDSKLVTFGWADRQKRVFLGTADSIGGKYKIKQVGRAEKSGSQFPDRFILLQSTDKRHIAANVPNGRGHLIHLWSPETDRIVTLNQMIDTPIRDMIWSPRENRLLYATLDDDTGIEVQTYDMDTGAQTRHMVRVSGGVLRLLAWAPDGQSFAVRYNGLGRDLKVDVFSLRGDHWPNIGKTMDAHQKLWHISDTRMPFAFSSEGRAIVFIEYEQASDSFNLSLLHLDTGHRDVLLDHVETDSFAYPGQSRFVIAHTKGGKQALTALDADGTDRITLVEGIQGQIDWKLTKSGRSLAYVLPQGDLFDVVFTDIYSGQQRKALEGLQAVNDLMAYWKPPRVQIVWRKPDGSMGMDAYAEDGRRLYRLPVQGDYPREWLSPDGRLAVITSSGAGDKYLFQVASTDGKWASPVLTGPSEPMIFWSPEGTHIALKYFGSPFSSIAIISADGQVVRQLVDVDNYAPDYMWTRCIG